MLVAGAGRHPPQAAIPEGGIDPPHSPASGPLCLSEGLSGRRHKVRQPGLGWRPSIPLPRGRTGPGPAMCRNRRVPGAAHPPPALASRSAASSPAFMAVTKSGAMDGSLSTSGGVSFRNSEQAVVRLAGVRTRCCAGRPRVWHRWVLGYPGRDPLTGAPPPSREGGL